MVRLILLAIFIPLLSCKSQRNSQKDNPVNSPIKFSVYKSGNYSGIEAPRQLRILNIDQWTSLWDEIHSNVTPKPSLPEINFTQNELIACFMGMRNSGGYFIKINEIKSFSEGMSVAFTHYSPGANCVTTMALTQPYTIVILEKQAARGIIFEQSEKKEDCKR